MSINRKLARDGDGPAICLRTYNDNTAVFAFESLGAYFSIHLSAGEVQQLAAFFNESALQMEEGEPV
jgi:hypothetical protein